MPPDPYRSYLGDCAKRAMADKVRRGLPPGRIPLGYQAEQNGNEIKIVQDERAPLIAKAFRLASELRLRQVVAEMRRLGLTGAAGRPIGLSSLYTVLTNPFYMGMVRYGGETVRGNHEPLVDEAQFVTVHHTLRQRFDNESWALVKGVDIGYAGQNRLSGTGRKSVNVIEK